MPHVSAAKTAREVAVFPGVVEMETGIIASSIVTNPSAVVMDVRSFGMTRFVVKTWCWMCRTMTRCRAMFRNKSATDRVSSAMLRPERDAEDEGESENLRD
jgi:hypothetical protein